MNGKTKMMLTMDSFATIWLLTLPEKVNTWQKHHDTCAADGIKVDSILSPTDSPSFAEFTSPEASTCLTANPETQSFQFLPDSWRLMECFEYFLDQHEKCSTPSIEFQFN